MEGILALLAGLMMLVAPQGSVLVAFKFIGVYWLIAGFLTAVQIFSAEASGNRVWLLIQGTLTVAAALFVLNVEPGQGRIGAALLMWSVAACALAIGVVGLLQALRGGGWAAGILGLLSLALGGYVLGGQTLPFGLIAWLAGLLTVGGGAASIYFALQLKTAAEIGAEIDTANAGDKLTMEGATTARSSGNPLLGVFRLAALMALLLVGVAATFVAWLLPMERQGIRLHFWVVTWLCRIINRLLHVEVVCIDKDKLVDLHGILFVNHVSFLDVPLLVSVLPMRFLSTADVYQVPFIGWAADAIATVFVDRSDKASRADVRTAIAQQVTEQAYPPFVIFPEGRFGTASSLRPFHHGSFAIAAENRIPYLLCALRYNRPDIAIWRGVQEESFFHAAARVLSFRGWIRGEIHPLGLVHPRPDDDAVLLAHDAQRAVEAALGFAPGATNLEPDMDAAHHAATPHHHPT